MSMNISFSFEQATVDSAISNTQELIAKFGEQITQIVLATANQAQSEAKAACPVETGALQQSITVDEIVQSDSNITVNVGTDLSYAIYVEMGHKTRGGGGFVAAQPFLFPTIESCGPNLVEALNTLANSGGE